MKHISLITMDHVQFPETSSTPAADQSLATTKQEPQDLIRAFHRLWSSCVGTKDYNKEAWLEVQKQLNQIGIKA